MNIRTTARQTFDMYNRAWHLKAIETESKQRLVFDPGGWSGYLCDCPFWEGGARCIVGEGGGGIREAFATLYSHLRCFSFPCFQRQQYNALVRVALSKVKIFL